MVIGVGDMEVSVSVRHSRLIGLWPVMSCLEVGGRILPALRSYCESGEMLAAWPVSGCDFGGGVAVAGQIGYDE